MNGAGSGRLVRRSRRSFSRALLLKSLTGKERHQRHSRPFSSLTESFWKILQELLKHSVESLRFIDEKCMTGILEYLELNVVPELRFQ